VQLRTAARADAITVLARAGAEVTATAPDVLTIKGLSSERTVAALTGRQIPFTEVSAHRATLEEAYMELTRDAVEFRAAPADAPAPAPAAAPTSATPAGPAPTTAPGGTQ
jgi:ABC-2 type transport system ATP-binding protein